MPVKHGLLALLSEGPAHGYKLRSAFEARTGGSWQLNIGQVYSTLQRLERDGLIEAVASDEDRITYAATSAGLEQLDRWYATPLVPVPPPRDELAIKVLLAIGSPQVDEHAVIQRQRTAVIEHLQDLTRRKRDLDPLQHLEELLHLDALLFRAEAEVRWLDLCEARLRQQPVRPTRSEPLDDAADREGPPPRAAMPQTATPRSTHQGPTTSEATS